MPYKKYPLLNKKNVKVAPISERQSLVHITDFARPFMPGADFQSFVDGLPNILAAKELREFSRHMIEARRFDKPIVWGMGGHMLVIGLGPVLIDLMERGWISAIASNGAFMIHDFEIALAGGTSEAAAENRLADSTSVTEETGLFLSLALKEGMLKNMGAGEAVGYYLIQAKLPHLEHSVLYHAYKLNIPVTIHPGIGTDCIHTHPMFVGEVTGALAERDFNLFSSIIAKISAGGVYLNIGSAVIMPEVFMRAVSFCAAQGIELKDFYTAVFDFIRQYRAQKNVIQRPISGSGKGYYFIGHHELMIPLLAAIITREH